MSGIEPLAAGSEVWFVDIWGVMHNGVTPYAEAIAACRTFRQRGGLIVLVSNAPRPWSAVQAGLDKVGVPRDAYDAIQSSGDTARALIAAAEPPVYHLGPDRDLPIYEGLSVVLTGALDARAVVCTGLVNDEVETAEDYRGLVEGLAQRGLPMICANPDLTVERGGKIIPCAGAVAAIYAELGGEVRYAGKPFPPIYEAAFGVAEKLAGKPVPKRKFLAIGDGVRTDIAGAAAVGLASVYIASKVHMEGEALTLEELARLFPDPAVRPVAAMTGLVW